MNKVNTIKTKKSKKYEFTGETKTLSSDTVLHRIRRLSDGLLGGWIESEKNLSHEGTCFVYGNARVFEDAEVFGNAQVFGDAWVFGNAWADGNMVVCGKMWYDPDMNIKELKWILESKLYFKIKIL